MNRQWWWTVGVAALLVACGPDDDDDASAAATGAATTAPSDSDAADRFLDLVEPLNCQLGAAAQLPSDASSDEIRDMTARVASAETEFVDGLLSTVWPTDAQAAVDRLVAATSRQADQWQAVADGESDDPADVTEAAAASADVREALGLEQTDVFCPGEGG